MLSNNNMKSTATLNNAAVVSVLQFVAGTCDAHGNSNYTFVMEPTQRIFEDNCNRCDLMLGQICNVETGQDKARPVTCADFGTVQVKAVEPNVLSLCDGRHRIIRSSLFLCAVRDWCADDSITSEVNGYLVMPNGKPRLDIELDPVSSDTFSAYVNHTNVPSNCNKSMKQDYDRFAELLKSKFGNELRNKLTVSHDLMRKLNALPITIHFNSSESKTSDIFFNANDNRVREDITDFQMVKSFALSHFAEGKEEHSKKTAKNLECLLTPDDKDNTNDYQCHFMACYAIISYSQQRPDKVKLSITGDRVTIGPKNAKNVLLLDYIPKCKSNDGTAALDEMYEAAQAYDRMMHPANHTSELPANVVALLKQFDMLRNSHYAQKTDALIVKYLLYYADNRLSSGGLYNLLLLLLQGTVISNVLGKNGAFGQQAYGAMFDNIQVEDNMDGVLLNRMHEYIRKCQSRRGTHAMPTESDIRRELPTKQFKSSLTPVLKFLLAVDIHVRNHFLTVDYVLGKYLTDEHIIPQHWSSNWLHLASEHTNGADGVDETVTYIGNRMLLESDANIINSNKCFIDKRPQYQSHDTENVNKDVIYNGASLRSEWTLNNVCERSIRITENIIKWLKEDGGYLSSGSESAE